MRRIHAAAFVSLDGVMQGPGGPHEDITGGFAQGGWVFKLFDPEVSNEMGRLFDRDYDLLLGRRTYDIFAGYWPHVAEDPAGIGAAFTACRKYVLSRGAPDLVIQGSSTLYPPLLAAGLIDRLTLMIFPAVLGQGKRLFGEGTQPGLLSLVEQRAGVQGTLIATYEQGGSLPPMPDFAPQQSTSERETARQQAMREGVW